MVSVRNVIVFMEIGKLIISQFFSQCFSLAIETKRDANIFILLSTPPSSTLLHLNTGTLSSSSSTPSIRSTDYYRLKIRASRRTVAVVTVVVVQ